MDIGIQRQRLTGGRGRVIQDSRAVVDGKVGRVDGRGGGRKGDEVRRIGSRQHLESKRRVIPQEIIFGATCHPGRGHAVRQRDTTGHNQTFRVGSARDAELSAVMTQLQGAVIKAGQAGEL